MPGRGRAPVEPVGISAPSYAEAVVTCSFCGTTAPGDDPPLTWSTAVENGQPRLFCDTCSRTHLRAMESKLDSEWW